MAVRVGPRARNAGTAIFCGFPVGWCRPGPYRRTPRDDVTRIPATRLHRRRSVRSDTSREGRIRSARCPDSRGTRGYKRPPVVRARWRGCRRCSQGRPGKPVQEVRCPGRGTGVGHRPRSRNPPPRDVMHRLLDRSPPPDPAQPGPRQRPGTNRPLTAIRTSRFWPCEWATRCRSRCSRAASADVGAKCPRTHHGDNRVTAPRMMGSHVRWLT